VARYAIRRLRDCRGKLEDEIMANKIDFVNDGQNRAQVSVTINNSGLRNFQLFSGESDEGTMASSGDVVWLWWRDDGQPCSICDSGAEPCSRNDFTMGERDVEIKLSSWGGNAPHQKVASMDDLDPRDAVFARNAGRSAECY
jgi:hypothetical protein